MEWINNNLAWIFSGVGCLVLSGIITGVIKLINKGKEGKEGKVVNGGSIIDDVNVKSEKRESIESLKAKTHILFIDDERFSMVDILRSVGWRNTQYKKDIVNLQDPSVLSAHIIFVDIYGVGTTLFKDQGFGLANALKDKYPNKVIIICSGEDQGNIFNKTLRKVDECISKSAEPYEYISMVEEFAQSITLE